MVNVKKVVSIVSLALLLGSSTLLAESTSAASAGVKTEKNASALLKNMYDYIGSMQKYAFKARITNLIENEEDALIEVERTSRAKVQRDGMFRVDTKGDNVNRSVYLANGVFTMIDNKEKYYASVNTKQGIDGTLDEISEALGIVLPLSTLIHSDMSHTMNPKRVQYFGTRVLGGVTCNYIAFRKGKTVVHLWVEDSATPLVHAAKIVNADVGTTAMILEWDTNPRFKNSTFTFKAPYGASNVSIVPAN